MIKPLIWKEWHEQRWKLILGCVLLIGYTAIGLQSRLWPDMFIVFSTCGWAAPFLPIFVVMGLFSVEKQDGTFERLLSLPIKVWKIFAVKLMVGGIICILPMLSSMLVSVVIAAGREMTAWRIISPYLGSMAFILTMFIWSASIGVRQPTEARSALVGIVIFIVWAAVVMIADEMIARPIDRWSLAITPFGFFEIGWDRDYSLLPKTIPIQLLLAGCLIVWGARRFSRLEKTKI
jgi:ABC-type transport system involved in multi-copper enzyme maturation permease subunit